MRRRASRFLYYHVCICDGPIGFTPSSRTPCIYTCFKRIISKDFSGMGEPLSHHSPDLLPNTSAKSYIALDIAGMPGRPFQTLFLHNLLASFLFASDSHLGGSHGTFHAERLVGGLAAVRLVLAAKHDTLDPFVELGDTQVEEDLAKLHISTTPE